MASVRRQLSISGALFGLLALAMTAEGQSGGAGASRSTGNGLLGNPSGGGGGTLGGGSTSSFSTLSESSVGGTAAGSRIGPIPQGEVSTIRNTQQFSAPQNGVLGGGNSIGGGGVLGGGNSNNGGNNGNSGGGNDGGGNNGNNNNRNHALDSRGGYFYGNRYWWRGGYWDGACYACGIWRSDTPGYPTCPACQYYDPDQRLCITVQDCPNN